ncbi:MAG: UvrD-helicase domain-containing protein [Actinobacteria bacterium]|nr:UvrD-helicase domain-containing protein [Actinomycetota bacterium]
MSAVAPDQPARDRISGDLRSTLFVEAGAGSGKTSSLVRRVVALVASGTAEMRSIAAITFTEKAAAELRDRIRRALDEAVAEALDEAVTEAVGEEVGDDHTGSAVRARCATALDQLDAAAIGTLHAFAQRILAEHPVEAGLPPRLEVLDEVASEVAFERRWLAFRDELLADRTEERTLMLFIASGIRPAALRVLALAFDRNWDLVAERVPATAPEPPDVRALLRPILGQLDAVCARVDECRDGGDKLAGRLADLVAYADRLRAATDEAELLELLGNDSTSSVRPSTKVSRVGRAANWDDVDGIRSEVSAAGQALDAARDEVLAACAERLASSLGRFTLAAAGERRAAGRLAFHDLLVLARTLVRDADSGADVRRRLHTRYSHLLLDEFQDTDPIQIDLAVRIAAREPESPEAGAARWDDIPVEAGHLFFVGDPKQSIYRFRRADIATFLAAQRRFGTEGGLVELSSNFRTGEPLIGWVNQVFGSLIVGDAGAAVPSQPSYAALAATRPGPPVGPAVSVIGRAALDGNASALRAAEADAVAATVTRAVAEGWSVASDDGDGDDVDDHGDRDGGGDSDDGDRDSGAGDGGQRWRPARLGDITILVPARTSLAHLEEALDRAGIPYRAESSSLVYASRAVRDVLMVLRAVDDPSDQLAVVSALRTPLLACGDDDLFRFKVERRGSWTYTTEQPASVPPDDPVAAALAVLRDLHRDRHWLAPSELLERIARERRAFEIGFAEGRPRDVWRRLRYVIDQAREWAEATGGGLREYRAWVERQTAEGARVAEAVLPETDDDAVRIMTIHAAKGLEFPITILSGMSSQPRGQRSPAEVVFPPGDGVGYRFGTLVSTEDYEAWAPIDEQMGHDERIRLLYVACTRARDHLVVSLQRKPLPKSATPGDLLKRTSAEVLVWGMGDLLDSLPDAVDPEAAAAPVPPPRPPPAPAPFEDWAAERMLALRRAARPSTVAATALTDEGAPDTGAADPGAPDSGAAGDEDRHGGGERHEAVVPGARAGRARGPDAQRAVDDAGAGLEKRPRDLDLPPWMKGRYGTAVGRAVHGVLQTIDLGTGAGLEAAVSAQCQAEAIPDRAGDVRALVESALGAPAVRDAAARPHWREVYACTPIGGRLLEGYVDLLYRGDEGLVVVDHKTAATSDRAELARRVAGYRLQGAAYALAVGRTTGEPVVRVLFLFLTPSGAVEIQLDDLAAATAEVEDLVSNGEELVVG